MWFKIHSGEKVVIRLALVSGWSLSPAGSPETGSHTGLLQRWCPLFWVMSRCPRLLCPAEKLLEERVVLYHGMLIVSRGPREPKNFFSTRDKGLRVHQSVFVCLPVILTKEFFFFFFVDSCKKCQKNYYQGGRPLCASKCCGFSIGKPHTNKKSWARDC